MKIEALIPTIATLLLLSPAAAAQVDRPAATVEAPLPDGATRGEAAPLGEAPYRFALAKLLLGEGEVHHAMDAFERTVELEPTDPYVRLEYADFLRRLAQSQVRPEARHRYLARATEQVEVAWKAAPDNLDVLRAAGLAFRSIADEDPKAEQRAIDALEAVRRERPSDLQSMLALGQIYRSRGEPDRAAEVFAEAASHTPDNRILYTFLADAYEAAGRNREAERALEKILELEPESVEIRVRLAELLAQRGDHAGALEVLRSAPPEVADEVQVRSLLARELYLQGSAEKALAITDALVAEVSGRVRIFVGNLRAAILADLGRDEEALEEYRALLEEAPDNAELVRGITRQLVNEGKRSEAIEVLASFLRRNHRRDGPEAEAAETLETARLTLGVLYVEEERWGEALETLKPLLESAQGSSRIAAVLTSAEAHYRADRPRKADRLLGKLQDEAPAVAGKRLELMVRSGDDERAFDYLDELLEAGSPEAVMTAVQVFHSRQRWEETLPYLHRLVEAHPDSLEPHFLLGAASERSGAIERAAEVFERALEIEPDDAQTLNYLGYMWAEQGRNLEQARELVERAVDLDPDNGAYRDSLGWALFQLGQYEQAREELERAVELVPGDAVVHEHLGDLYAAMDEPNKAAEAYRRALHVAGTADSDLVQVVRRKLDDLTAD